VERATAAEPAFAPGPESRATIERLCEQLDGLPLAIELAAPYVRMLSLGELAARLGERLDPLSSRGTTVTGRALDRPGSSGACSVVAGAGPAC
jgi:predicted ATPase